ncbi:MAG: hypothetical protein KDB07_05970, partial [Planctomycetes bacterium]|nr:hypothetical protein [Planctomycetota bacterium]
MCLPYLKIINDIETGYLNMPNEDFVQLDRIEWHIEDDSLPQHLVDALVDPESEEHDEDAYELLATYACAHVGLFLRYCFSKGMAGASALEQEDAVRDVASGAMTGVDYFLNFCDGKLFIT